METENKEHVKQATYEWRVGTYPGAYCGRVNWYPKTLKVKPASGTDGAEADEASNPVGTPRGDPCIGHLSPTNINVTVAATPSAIANFANNELLELPVSFSKSASDLSLGLSP